MAQGKNSFVLYCDLIHTLNKLPDEKAGQLFKHILAYVNDQNPTTDDLLIEVAFEPIKQKLKQDLKMYEAKCLENQANGKLGGRPVKIKTDNNRTVISETNGLNSKAKKPDIDIDLGIDTDIDTEYESDKKIPSHIPSLTPISNYEGLTELCKDPAFEPDMLPPDGLAAALIDLFRIRYNEEHGNQYIVGKWDKKTLEDLVRLNKYKPVHDGIIEYFKLDRKHTVKEFADNISDEFERLQQRTPVRAGGSMFSKM